MAQTIRIKDADGNELKLLANSDGSYSLPVKAELSGRNVERTTIVDSLAVTDTAGHAYGFNANFLNWDLIITNTHDQPAKIAIYNPVSIKIPKTDGTLVWYGGGVSDYGHVIPSGASKSFLGHFPIEGVTSEAKLPYKGMYGYLVVMIRFPGGAPTTGSITIELMGVV